MCTAGIDCLTCKNPGVLACPKVAAAFGPQTPGCTTLRRSQKQPGHWARKTGGRRPKPRLDAQGRRLCAREGCDRLRHGTNHLCREHRNEYYNAWSAANPERRAAYREKQRLERESL